MDTVFEKPQKSQIREQVFVSIRDAITHLRIRPGQRLVEAQLAEQLGVSKTPIREALVRLEQLGLVVTESYKGAVVTGYTVDDIREVYELRELLQGFAARQAATGISEDDLKRLQRNILESQRLHEKGKTGGLPDIFDEFDLIIDAQASNSRIVDLLNMLQHHMIRIGNLTVGIPGRVEVSISQHRAISEAIADRDPTTAEQRMREHVRSVLKDHLASEEALASLRAPATASRTPTEAIASLEAAAE